MILCNKYFAHDIIKFDKPRKDKNNIAFVTRRFIRFKMFLMERNDYLQKLYSIEYTSVNNHKRHIFYLKIILYHISK